MNLFGGYLLVVMILFLANIALLLGNRKLDNQKIILLSAIFAVISFITLNISLNLAQVFSFLNDWGSYLFFAIFVFMIVLYLKRDDFRFSAGLMCPVYLISILLLSSQSDLDIVTTFLYSLFVFIVLFVVYQLSKLLHHAKRQYSVITGEFICLSSVLIFIFSLTYNSTKTLDYTMFSSFLILTPTYQLIYVVIAIIVILVIGVLINDKGGNS